jgi:hypothetical protein
MIYNYTVAISVAILAIVVIVAVTYGLGRLFGVWHSPRHTEELRDLALFEGCTAEGCPGEAACRSAPGYGLVCGLDDVYAMAMGAELTRKQAFTPAYPMTHEAVDVADMTLRLTAPHVYADDWAETSIVAGSHWANEQAGIRAAFRKEMGLAP